MTRNIPDAHILSVIQTIACPIARIEAARKMSPMAQMVRHTREMPSFL